MKIKAISLHQPWATLIRDGAKTIETRSWPTSHRGPLLICASASPVIEGHVCGKALTIVDVIDCRPMTFEDADAAKCDCWLGAWAWVLTNNRPLERPFVVKGRQGLFHVELPADAQPLLEAAPTAERTAMPEPVTPEPAPPAPAAPAALNLQDLFTAHANIEAARKRLAQAKRDKADAAEELSAAKEHVAAAADELDMATAKLVELVGGAKPPEFGRRPYGWIDQTTPIGRRFNIQGSDDRVEYRGTTDGKVQVAWADGLLEGETFFPAGDITVEAWNADYAAKVEGYVDVRPGPEAAASEQAPAPEAAADAPAAPPAAQANPHPAQGENDGWMAVRLDSLTGPAISPSILARLAEHEPPITTLGELASWTNLKGQYWTTDIHGIGPAAAEEIAAATDAFWARRRPENR